MVPRASAADRCRVVLEARLPAPLRALAAIGPERRPFLRLAAGAGFRGTRWSFLAADPVAALRLERPDGRDLAAALAALRVAPRTAGRATGVPFAGGWAGFLGYEARSWIESRPAPRAPPLGFPVVHLARYPAVLAWNHATGRTFLAAEAADERAARSAARALGRLATRPPPAPGRIALDPPRPRTPAARFRAHVETVREAILDGEIFQANVSQRFDARGTADPVALFTRLASAQPAPYMTFLGLGDGRFVLSASPERFVRVMGRRVETDPMKGTRPRGATRAEDHALRAELAASEKERAELAMIVDLSRNDLARTCRPGSVRVAVPRRLLRFANVHQAIAVVSGTLAPGADRIDLLAAAFPPGSVTGAPKIRAMEWIDRLEGEGRGPYCGALGWFDSEGDLDLAVGIRTVLATPTTASYRVGAGITLRSEPEAEWRETLAKGRGLFAAIAGREPRS